MSQATRKTPVERKKGEGNGSPHVTDIREGEVQGLGVDTLRGIKTFQKKGGKKGAGTATLQWRR